MANLVNPVSFRLGISLFWTSRWSLLNSKIDYFFIFKKNYLIISYLKWLSKYKFANHRWIKLANYKLYVNVNNKIYIKLYYYDKQQELITTSPLNFNIKQKLRYNYIKTRVLKFEKYNKLLHYIYNSKKINKYMKFRLNKSHYLSYQMDNNNNNFFKSYCFKPFSYQINNTNNNNKFFVYNKHYRLITSYINSGNVYFTKIKLILFNLSISSKYSKVISKRSLIITQSLYYHILAYSISYYLKKLSSPSVNNYIFKVSFYKYSPEYITPQIIANYISSKVQQRYGLNWVIRPVLRDLKLRKDLGLLAGYRILCSGRFTRKQRATRLWYNVHPVPNDDLSSNVFYAESKTRLKFGMCGIKVWLNAGFMKLRQKLIKSSTTSIYPIMHSCLTFSQRSSLFFPLNTWNYSIYKLYINSNFLCTPNYFYWDINYFKFKFIYHREAFSFLMSQVRYFFSNELSVKTFHIKSNSLLSNIVYSTRKI